PNRGLRGGPEKIQNQTPSRESGAAAVAASSASARYHGIDLSVRRSAPQSLGQPRAGTRARKEAGGLVPARRLCFRLTRLGAGPTFSGRRLCGDDPDAARRERPTGIVYPVL